MAYIRSIRFTYLRKDIHATTQSKVLYEQWRVICRLELTVCKKLSIKDGLLNFTSLMEDSDEMKNCIHVFENWTCELLSWANWTHTSTHSLLWIKSSSAPATNGSFKTFFELVSKERIQNWVGCTVSVHQNLEIRLQDVDVSAGWKRKMSARKTEENANHGLLTFTTVKYIT